MYAKNTATLGDALALGDRRVVAFTGGGRQTSAMFRLASELAAERVLVTTTTKIWVPRPEQANLCVVEDLGEARRRLKALWHGGVRALGTAITPEGKLQGIPPEWVGPLAEIAGRVLVEADGAAGKPLTVPRDYEPVIPANTELLVPVCGLDAVGAPLDEEHVHRAPEMAACLCKIPGAPLTVADVADVMLSRWGNVKGAPAAARIVPLVNKVDILESVHRVFKEGRSGDREELWRGLGEARDVAKRLLSLNAPRVVLATLASTPPRFQFVCADAGPDELSPAQRRA